MTDRVTHYTDEQFFRLIDGDIDPDERTETRDHLSTCSRCRERFESLAGFNRALRRMPLSRVSPFFTRTVLSAAGVKQLDSAPYRLLEYAAGLFGLLVVLAFSVTALVLWGVIRPTAGEEARSPSGVVMGIVGSAMSQTTGQFGKVLKEYFPFLFGADALWVSFGAVLVVLTLAALDRTFAKGFVERRR